MKFGKYLTKVIEFSDPEWGPYWINYKLLKKKIHDIVDSRMGTSSVVVDTCPAVLAKDPFEVDFFKSLRYEVRKASDFFSSNETLFHIRHTRIQEGFKRLNDTDKMYDQVAWARLLAACVQFYKDVLLLENFAIMNYCGFSKILKKHDKTTGYVTRAAFMKNVTSKQNFAGYEYISELLVHAEKLFIDIQSMKNLEPMRQEEFDYLDAIRNLKQKAKVVQEVENRSIHSSPSSNAEVPDHSNWPDSLCRNEGSLLDTELATAEGLVSLQKSFITQIEQDEQDAQAELLVAIDRLQPRNPVTSSTASSSASEILLEVMKPRSSASTRLFVSALDFKKNQSMSNENASKELGDEAEKPACQPIRMLPLSTASTDVETQAIKRRRL